MPLTRQQHFVPQTYLKAWVTKVTSDTDPTTPFSGFYVFDTEDGSGHGLTTKSVLWHPYLYTVNIEQTNVIERCPKIFTDFVNQIYHIMRERQGSSVYGKLDYSVIKTRSSIRRHFRDIDSWEFYRDNGELARTNAIRNEMKSIRSNVIEEGFSNKFELSWASVLHRFISEMHSSSSGIIGKSERHISSESANAMLSFFFMMLCRNPRFNCMGIYDVIANLLRSTFGVPEAQNETGNDVAKEMVHDLWLVELYRMLYGGARGFYHSALNAAALKLQMVLFEAYNDAGQFITNDNPAFQHYSIPEVQNMNGYIFPLSPKHLLFICKGDAPINIVDMRFADHKVVAYFNQAIYRNRTQKAISNCKDLSKLLS